MSTTTLQLIQRRRELLAARSELQRALLGMRAQPIRNALDRADRALAAVRRLQQHPVVIGFSLIAVVVLVRRRMWRVVRLGVSAWQAYRLIARRRY
jgi:hypothetical protein